MNLAEIASAIKPLDNLSYIDVIRVWLKVPLSPDEIDWVRNECRNHKLGIRNKRAWFDWNYTQRLRLHQPSRMVLEWLARRRDAHLNYVEVALDWIFKDSIVTEDAWEFVCRYVVKRHHRDQGIRFVRQRRNTKRRTRKVSEKATRYSGPRKAPTVLVVYRDRASKITGDQFCVHIEWRLKGIQTLRRIGIRSVGDLLKVNPNAFWSERLLFRGVEHGDLPRLGRMHNKWSRGSRRRGAWVWRSRGGFEYDFDKRTGGILMRACGSTQALIDEHRQEIDFSRVLTTIDQSHLLPSSAFAFP